MRFLRSVPAMVLGGALVLFLSVYGFGRYNDWREQNRTNWERKYNEAQDSVKLYREISRRDSIVYVDRVRPEYIRVRDRTIADPQTSEATRKVIRACDLVVAACDSIQVGLRGRIRALEVQNDLLEHRPGPPRIVGYGDLLYDVVGLRPVVRVGGNVKVLGPLQLRVEGEYAVPSQLREGVGDGARVLIGARINFNK